MKKLIWFVALWPLCVALALAQSPQSQTAPLYAVNAKYTNGLAPGYWPTQQAIPNGSGGTIAAATGLNINVGPGTVNCGSGNVIAYNGGTKLLTASATNRIYLDTTSSCAVSVKTSAFVSTDIPIAVVVTGGSSITTITDDRTPFSVPSNGGGSNPNGRIITSSTTAACGEYLRSDATVGITVTLPTIAQGCMISVEMHGIGVPTIDPNGQPYDGLTNQLFQGGSVLIWTDGTSYHSKGPIKPGTHCTLTPGVVNTFDCDVPSDPTTIDVTAPPYYASPWGATTTTGTFSASATSGTVASCSTFVANNGISIAGGASGGWSGTLYIGKVVGCVGTTLTITPAITNSVSGAVVKHDETIAIRAARDALPIGGTLDFPNASISVQGKYLVNGAPEDPSGANAIINMPVAAGLLPLLNLKFRGFTKWGSAPIIASDVTTSGIKFFGGKGSTAPNFTNVGLWFHDITIQLPNNTNATAIDGTWVQVLSFEGVVWVTTASPSGIPTTGFGVLFPTIANNVILTAPGTLDVAGFGTDVRLGEHAASLQILVSNTTNGVVPDVAPTGFFGDGTPNTITIGYLWCGPPSVPNGPTTVANCITAGSSQTTLIVHSVDYEGTGGTLVNDPSNLLHGHINYAENNNSSCGTPATVSGGANLTFRDLNCGAGGKSTTTVGAVTPNHIAVFNDAAGTIKDGGTIPSATPFPGTNGVVVNTSPSTSRNGNSSDLSSIQYVAGAGTGQAQTVTLVPAITSLTNGLIVRWLPTAANTGAAPTLAVNGLTATAITKCGTMALVANDLTATAVAEAIYDGTQFQLFNPQTAGCGSGATTATGTSPIQVNGNSGTPQNGPFTVSCPTCSVGSGTAVNVNGGSTLGTSAQNGLLPYLCADSSGSGTAQTCTTSPSFTPQAGNCFAYTTTTTNSGIGLTVNIDALGAKSIAIPSSLSGWTTTLTAGIIPANKPLELCYDGTNFNVQQTGTLASSGAMTNITSAVTASGCTVGGNVCSVGTPSNAVTFSNIPSGYNEIIIIVQSRVSDAGNTKDMGLNFNSDTGSNYFGELHYGQGTSITGTVSYTGSSPQTGILLVASGASANISSYVKIDIPFYAASGTFFHDYHVSSGSPVVSSFFQTQELEAEWRSTSAITSVKMSDNGSGNFVAGSNFIIYGVN